MQPFRQGWLNYDTTRCWSKAGVEQLGKSKASSVLWWGRSVTARQGSCIFRNTGTLQDSRVMSHKECMSNWAQCLFFCWSVHETISIILDEYTAAGVDAAARFNLQIKITLFKMGAGVPSPLLNSWEVNSNEPWLQIYDTLRANPSCMYVCVGIRGLGWVSSINRYICKMYGSGSTSSLAVTLWF